MSKTKKLFVKTGGDFIDPANVNSFVRYHVQVIQHERHDPKMQDYVSCGMTMSLGDCSRVINWEFDPDEDEGQVQKMEKVLTIISEALEDLRQAADTYKHAKHEIEAKHKRKRK